MILRLKFWNTHLQITAKNNILLHLRWSDDCCKKCTRFCVTCLYIRLCGGYRLAISNALHSSVLTFYIIVFFISLTNCCAVLWNHFLCLIPVYWVIKFVDFWTFSVNFSRILLMFGNVKSESFLKVFELLKYIHLFMFLSQLDFM